MAIPALTLRNTKGAALTFTEMDTNLQNLANAVVSVTAGGVSSNVSLNGGLTFANSATINSTNSSGTITTTANVTAILASITISNTATVTGTNVNGALTFTAVADVSSVSGNINLNSNYLNNAQLGHTREKVFAIGNSGATTVAVNAANGPIQSITATGNFTINTTQLSNFNAGQSVTLVITQDGTGSRTLTSNLKYAGGSKTLSTAANSIDTISITYDGTNYLAGLVKGYA